jgi:hypothetical protein
MKFKNLVVISIFMLVSFNLFSESDTLFFSGAISETEIWQGIVFLTGSVAVEEGASLIIEPGTKIFVKSDRDYKSFKKGGIFVNGGTIKAIGTPDQMIWFTSDHPVPINGDWGGIEISNSTNSEFKYCIIEYAELGIAQYFSQVNISHSIVRWNNSEGIYAENSTATFENNRLYANAYHEIALENKNVGMIVRNNEFGPQNRAIIFQTSDGTLRHNYIHDYKGFPIVDVTLGSNVLADSNLFLNCPPPVFNSEPLGNIDTSGTNDFTGLFIQPPDFDFPDTVMHELSYVPGDTTDKYPYVYDIVDQTRKIIRRYGKGIGFGWSVGFANGYAWKHDTEFLTRIDTATGNTTLFTNSPTIEGPGGLTHDGTYFWAYDRNVPHNISKFEISGDSVRVLLSFPAPEAQLNRALGLTTDSIYLYQSSVANPWIYKIDMSGNVVDTIMLSTHMADLVVWTGDGFWGTGGEKGWGKWSPTGTYIGSSYPVAHGCWGMSWDGEYLWSINKTCEIWNDAKIFKSKILNLITPTSNETISEKKQEPLLFFPNPVRNYLNLKFEIQINTPLKVFLYSQSGQLISVLYNGKPTLPEFYKSFNLSHIPVGSYILQVQHADKIYSGILVKTN